LQRAIEDALFAVKVLVKDSRIVPGAGACEMELAKFLASHAEKTPGITQYAIKKYAEAFESVARALAVNAGYDGTQILSRLHWAHEEGNNPSAGIDIDDEESSVLDASKVGIWDVLAVKKSAVHLGTEAALTVLRIDQIIMSKPAGGPKPSKMGAQDSADD